MYRVVAKMRLLISEPTANSASKSEDSSPPSVRHSAMDPRHSDLIGKKWSPPKSSVGDEAETATVTARIVQITRKLKENLELPIFGSFGFPLMKEVEIRAGFRIISDCY